MVKKIVRSSPFWMAVAFLVTLTSTYLIVSSVSRNASEAAVTLDSGQMPPAPSPEVSPAEAAKQSGSTVVAYCSNNVYTLDRRCTLNACANAWFLPRFRRSPKTMVLVVALREPAVSGNMPRVMDSLRRTTALDMMGEMVLSSLEMLLDFWGIGVTDRFGHRQCVVQLRPRGFRLSGPDNQ